MTTIAAAMQLLIAVAFVTIPLVRHRYGPAAQAAAERELARQGVPARVLAENGLRFDAGGHETAAPAAVALIMTVLAALNLAGNHWGEVLSWVFMPLVLAGNCVILYSQLTAAKSVRAAFARKGDPMLERVDVPAFLKASEAGFPRWVFPILQNVRHTAVFGGAAVALLATALA
ncbi:hypothetical protein [Spirillospora sp. NPDC029432]|uniref:hypothetical protein n=1 Tax=Spirillospora sp. NPDC029432 TaxID=3154599 RepID=UPI003454D1DD